MRIVTEEQQKAISMLSIYFSNFDTTKAEGYQQALADIPADILKATIWALVNTSKFLPTVAEIREKAREVKRFASGQVENNAGMAWEAVCDAIRKVGGYRLPTFEDAICAKVVRQIGWMNICMTPIEMTTALRAQFIKLYEKEMARVESEARLRETIPQKAFERIAKHVGEQLKLERGM